MPDQKLAEAIGKALSLIDEAGKAQGSDDPARKLLLWKLAAEAEYVAFRISATHNLFDYDNKTAVTDDLEVDAVEKARSYLLEIRSSAQTDPKRAYSLARRIVTLARRTDKAERRSNVQATKVS